MEFISVTNRTVHSSYTVLVQHIPDPRRICDAGLKWYGVGLGDAEEFPLYLQLNCRRLALRCNARRRAAHF